MNELRGNPGKRKRNKSEPRLPDGIGPAPRWLSRPARDHWKLISGLLGKVRVLTKGDRDALAIYCDAWARWRAATKTLERKGETSTRITVAGELLEVQRPEVAIARDLRGSLLRYQQELGLTPAARGNLVAPKAPGDGDTEKEKLFRLIHGGR